MAPRVTPPEDRDLERKKYLARIASAVNDADDPLAVYQEFIKWISKNYGDRDPSSGEPNADLVQVLRECLFRFKDGPLYKTDLRYLKLWLKFVSLVDNVGARVIYKILMEEEIGTSYAQLFESYAMLLEREGRLKEADLIYLLGIQKAARPLERLKKRYEEFQDRQPSRLSSTPSTSTPVTLSNSQLPNSSSSSSVRTPNPGVFKLMLAPPDPSKRPEKLMFNLGLLFTEDQVEYCIQEARARSMGLLGKKWPPLTKSESIGSVTSTPSSSYLVAPVNFNDDGSKHRSRPSVRRSLAEPTVTINTKEALDDVFLMYNSPDKTIKPGSKHIPLKQVDQSSYFNDFRSFSVASKQQNENVDRAVMKTPTSLLRPFVDENSFRTENRTPAAHFARLNENPDRSHAKISTPAFRPYVDENNYENRTPGTKFFNPDPQKPTSTTPRIVLSVKEATASISHPGGKYIEDKAPDPVFSRVFTPASKSVPLAPLRDVFTDDHGKPLPRPKLAPTHERAKSQHDTLSPNSEENSRPSAFTPFKVFTRPDSENSGHVFTPKTPSAAFVPFKDEPPSFTPFKDQVPSTNPFLDKTQPKRTILGTLSSSTDEPQHSSFGNNTCPDDQEEEQEEDLQQKEEPDLEEEYFEEEYSNIEENNIPSQSEYPPDEFNEGESYQEVPLGGRFGQFNVMTPITERTFEFTNSTRGEGTPSEKYTGEYEAAVAAVRLAEELQEDGGEDSDEDDNGVLEPLCLSAGQLPLKASLEVAIIEERTGSLSLLDTLTLSSKFRPSNPCNPFDTAILSSLITRIATDPHFYDLRNQESNKLDELERFSKKKRKSSSGGSNNTGTLDSSSFLLTLQGHRFNVAEKIGEGGFGCVFMARDIGVRDSGDDEDDDDDDDFDDDVSSMVALKVVKPRNVWEYHVLRRLHSALPHALRRSVVLPHALFAFADESYLVLDYCPQGTLLNIVNSANSSGVAQAGACLDELLVMFFSIELLRLLEGMHNIGFIHGDLKIDNCLLRLEDVPGGAAAWSAQYQPSGDGGWSSKGLKVIDFGRTIDMRLFPPGQQFVADWATDDRDCFEVRENRPWTYQTDYFGLAGIVYCMLFGKYIQSSSLAESVDENRVPRYKIVTPFKRYWQKDLWHRLFDILLNPGLVQPNGELPVCEVLAPLRKEMEEWLQTHCNRTSNTLKGLLKKVEMSVYK